MKKPTKKYILWVFSDGGYHPTEYDTVEEVLLAEKYSIDWYVTQSINDISAYANYKEPKNIPTKN